MIATITLTLAGVFGVAAAVAPVAADPPEVAELPEVADPPEVAQSLEVVKSSDKDVPPERAMKAAVVKGLWKVCQFGGDGPVSISEPKRADDASPADRSGPNPIDRVIELSIGDPMSGVYWDGSVPKTNYRLRYRAKRIEGFDFFAAATFPVGDDTITFVPGGWGGGVTGISSIDGQDASDNETTRYVALKTDRWYAFEIIVTDAKIVAKIDGEVVADVGREGKTFSMRDEMDVCKPLGFAAFQGDAIIRDITIDRLDATASKSHSGSSGQDDD